MSPVDLADLAVIVIVAVPLAFSAALSLALRLVASRGNASAAFNERTEQALLATMIAPAFVGAALLAFACVPGAPSVLPELGAFVRETTGTAALAAAPPVEETASWLPYTGAVLMAAWGALVALRLIQLLIASVRLARTAARAENAVAAWGEGVHLTGENVSAFAVGRRTIVLPKALTAAMSADDVAMIVAHEREHLRRGDPIYIFGLSLIEVLFPADPFVRAQVARCRLAAELACDRAVTQRAPQMRKAYAHALITALKHTAGNAWHCAPAVFSSRNQGDYRMRIAHIMSPATSPRKRWSLAALGLAAAVALPTIALQAATAASFTVAAASASFTVAPIAGRMTASYHEQIMGKTHDGVDIAAPVGTPIKAPGAGVVVRAEAVGHFGNLLEIDHGGGMVTRYAHLQKFEVAAGDHVEAGQLVGRVGNTGVSTGPHVHIEVYKDGKLIDPTTVLNLPEK
ncbi:MAG: peptidoglycan DD-metalloendopeptidase family protein [Alphaproteobacteria bacterium]|nr:peptidoglycan DD-metalloendopeptidase family protein [Alphaproteobacteria bacterium]